MGLPLSPDKKSLDALRIDRSRALRRGPSAAVVAGGLVVLLAGGMAAWWFSRTPAIAVRTVEVRREASGGERTLLNASGYVTARRQATVSSKVTGKVTEVLVEEGMKVEAGQELARIDASNVEKSIGLAEAQLESARRALGETEASLDFAERELRRLSRLAEGSHAGQVELDRAETDVKTFKARLERQAADVEVAERELAVWKQQLDDTIIRAPFAGVVTSKDAQPGEIVSPISAGGGFTRTGICTIVDMSSLEIEVDVSESYINRVTPGQTAVATLDSYPQWRIPAKVIAIIPTADRQKATVKVRVGFEKLDPRILPDMSVKVAFQSGTEGEAASSTLVPKAAISRDGAQDIAWVIRNQRAERRAVTVGGERGDDAVIAAGVSAGERVVVDAPKELTDGASVTEAE